MKALEKAKQVEGQTFNVWKWLFGGVGGAGVNG